VINRSDAVPYPILVNDGDSLSVDFSFRERYAYKTSWPHRAWQYLKSHTLLFSVLETRLKMLKAYGIKPRVDQQERDMTAVTTPHRIPDAISVPSSWPDSLIAESKAATAAVLQQWRLHVEADGRALAVLYIPRETQLGTEPDMQDSWAGWLFGFCEAQGIPVIDPSRELLHHKQSGEEIYYDHLSAGGHDAVAESFARWYRSNY
jgi:hypothetical protein